MFSITDNERLRDAYALLMFMQRDISASAEKKAAVKNLAATVKMEIRAYNNRPVSNVRIISADYDGRLELVGQSAQGGCRRLVPRQLLSGSLQQPL